MIKLDDKLKTLFPNQDQISMFQIPKGVSQHVKKDETK